MRRLSFRRCENTLVIRERGLLWKFSGVEKGKTIGQSIGKEFENLSDRVVVKMVLAEAKSLGFRGEKLL